MSNPEHLIRLANKRLIRASAELEFELTNKGPSYALLLFCRMRDQAAEAMAALTYIDPNNAEEIRTLQNELMIFDRFCSHLKAIVDEGIQLDAHEAEQGRIEAAEMVLQGAEGVEGPFGVDLGPSD